MIAYVLVALQQQQRPDPVAVVQAVLLGLAITFVFSVFAAGFTAKKINNIHNPTYSKAFLATMLKNMLGLAGFFLFGLFLEAPEWVVFAIAFSLIPIAIYKLVFSSMWREAALIWIVAFIVEVGLGYVLIIAGILHFQPQVA